VGNSPDFVLSGEAIDTETLANLPPVTSNGMTETTTVWEGVSGVTESTNEFGDFRLSSTGPIRDVHRKLSALIQSS